MIRSATVFCQTALSGAGLWLVMTRPGLAAGGGESSGGLPQLDISTWPTQIFWLLVSFALAYILLSRLVTPRIGQVLDSRANRINEDIAKAREAEAAARQTETDYLAELDRARSQASEQASKAVAEASKTAAQAEAELAKKLARKVKSAEEKLAKTRAEAMAGLETVAAEAAEMAVQQLAGFKPAKPALSKQIKQAMKNQQHGEAK